MKTPESRGSEHRNSVVVDMPPQNATQMRTGKANPANADTPSAREAAGSNVFGQVSVELPGRQEARPLSQSISKIEKMPQPKTWTNNYGSDQAAFRRDTKSEISNITQMLRAGKFENFDDLLGAVSTARKTIADNQDAVRYQLSGRMRTPEVDLTTKLFGENREAVSQKLMDVFASRISDRDPLIKIFDTREPALTSDRAAEYDKERGRHLQEATHFHITREGNEIELGKLGMATCTPPQKTFPKVELLAAHFDSLRNEEYVQVPLTNNVFNSLSWAFEDPTSEENKSAITRTFISHPKGEEFTALMNEMSLEFDEFKKSMREGNADDAKIAASNLVYLFANTCPLQRGSAWCADAIATVLMREATSDPTIDFSHTNLDFVAFGSSADQFRASMSEFMNEQTAPKGSVENVFRNLSSYFKTNLG